MENSSPILACIKMKEEKLNFIEALDGMILWGLANH